MLFRNLDKRKLLLYTSCVQICEQAFCTFMILRRILMSAERMYLTLPFVYYNELKPYSDEQVGRMIRALFRFAMFGEEIVFEGDERFFAGRLMDQEMLSRQKYEEKLRQRSRAGHKAAEVRWGKPEKKKEELIPEKEELIPEKEELPTEEVLLPEDTEEAVTEEEINEPLCTEEKAPDTVREERAPRPRKKMSLEETKDRIKAIQRMKKSGIMTPELEEYLMRNCANIPERGH